MTTFRFEDEFRSCTQKRSPDLRGRLFAGHTVLHIKKVHSQEYRLCYIETLPGRRERGFATDALKWLCEMADAYDVKLCLTPVKIEDDSTISVIQLTRWYQRFGFVRIGLQDEMVRQPNGHK